MYYNRAVVDNKEWRWVYLTTDSLLSEEDRDSLAIDAIRMYTQNKKRKSVKGKEFEGEIRSKGQGILGCFVGREYEVMLETNHGKSTLSFLMNPARLDPSLN